MIPFAFSPLSLLLSRAPRNRANNRRFLLQFCDNPSPNRDFPLVLFPLIFSFGSYFLSSSFNFLGYHFLVSQAALLFKVIPLWVIPPFPPLLSRFSSVSFHLILNTRQGACPVFLFLLTPFSPFFLLPLWGSLICSAPLWRLNWRTLLAVPVQPLTIPNP